MSSWKLFLLKLVVFIGIVPLLGYALLWVVEFIQKTWASNSRKQKWIAMILVAGAYLALSGWFY